MNSTLLQRGESAAREFGELALRLQEQGHVEGTECADVDRFMRELADLFRMICRYDSVWWTAVHHGRERYDAERAASLTRQYELWQEVVCPAVNNCIADTRARHPEADLENEADFQSCCREANSRLSGDRSFPANRKMTAAWLAKQPFRPTPEQDEAIRRAAELGGDSWARPKFPIVEIPVQS